MNSLDDVKFYMEIDIHLEKQFTKIQGVMSLLLVPYMEILQKIPDLS